MCVAVSRQLKTKMYSRETLLSSGHKSIILVLVSHTVRGTDPEVLDATALEALTDLDTLLPLVCSPERAVDTAVLVLLDEDHCRVHVHGAEVVDPGERRAGTEEQPLVELASCYVSRVTNKNGRKPSKRRLTQSRRQNV